MSIKSLREAKGLSQKELAKELGVDQSAVCLWENGKTFPRVPVAQRMAKILDCSLNELYSNGQENQ